MPIRPEMRRLYPADWTSISHAVRFGRAGGQCEYCGKPHGARIVQLRDGRWTAGDGQWRDRSGEPAKAPDILAYGEAKAWRRPVVLACCHMRHDPRESDPGVLVAACGACHLRLDREWHRRQRWVNWRSRYAIGDLLEGLYETLRLPSPLPVHRSMGAA
jgi:hypothetical protein